MLQSMTGYGKTELQLPTKKITIEIKSLNSKNLDLNVRTPSYYKEKEMKVRKTIASILVRGKVDFSIFVESIGQSSSSQINKETVVSYMNQLKEISPASELELLEMAIRLPETIQSKRESLDDNEWKEIEEGINTALKNIATYRKDEGEVLKQDFLKRIAVLQNLLDEVITIDPQRIENVKERLNKAISEIEAKVDENRFEQELIYYLEKFDITEEKVRLKNHLDYFLTELNSETSNGKKLGFITQEIGREINTIGSKANFADMQKLVVQMKDELEKIKEQNLNVL
ncbi:YicC/YloC family endoribonuclease [Urechidicola vernalis]|uniref:YicC/YloC family endoribonuclease n=1 Tax=Urechidicola vernalis TaxID=3075600 RepID=A0ABU2Y6A0_9FLAO|nr:YicC/YloC family endoribonuclease [Urechidicola sp. P050]MDT0553731.1 YicC/YloC family endoribonuclease [Urechidicola sp. P050]